MGRIFAIPPSPWEVDNVAAYVVGERHLAEFGTLPGNTGWRMLERRYDLNPLRFAEHHPNVAALIEQARQELHDGPGRPDFPPIDRCSPYVPECGCEQPPAHGGGGNLVVPEPSGLALGLVAAIVWMGVMWRRAR
jgi:hypothetical protein